MLNVVVLIGRLTADPELRHTTTGAPVTTFTLAVERSYAKQGERRETDFIDVVAWRNTAEFVTRYFHKGQMMAVQGQLQVRNYTDRDGNKRRGYEVQADNVHFAEPKRDSTSAPPERRYEEAPPSFATGDAGDFQELPGGDDDLPF